MTKERRLGRGLEALLGQLPGWNGTVAASAQSPQPQDTLWTLRWAGDDSRFARRRRRSGEPDARDGTSILTATICPPTNHRAAPLRTGNRRASSTIPTSRGRTSMPRSCNAWPTAFAPMDSCSRSSFGPWEGGFQLIAGERRLAGRALAGWTEVPVTVVEADERQTAELAIVENLQRKDLERVGKGGVIPALP